MVSLTIVAGVLVAGLTDSRAIPAVKAESHASHATRKGALAARLITARSVVVNGVPTDGFFDGQIEIVDSSVESPCGIANVGDGVYILGAYPAPVMEPPSTTGAYPAPLEQPSLTGAYPAPVMEPPSTTGAYPAPLEQPSLTGAYPAPLEEPSLTGAYPAPVYEGGSTYISDSVEVFGGVLEGEHIHVANGVIRGKNLRVVGAHVSGGCSR